MKEEFVFNDFRYSYNFEDEKFEIIFEKENPDFVYKYYSLSRNSLDSVINSYLYASHPFELNDSLDSSCFILHASKSIDFSQYKTLFSNQFSSELKLIEFYKLDVSNQCREFIRYYWENITRHSGIISLSSNEDDLLMWPHYTNEKGFQIKLNVNKLLKGIELDKKNTFKSILPINYSKDLQSFDISKYESGEIPFLYATNVKTIDWKYENEWRIVIGRDNMGVPLSKEKLSTISDIDYNHKNRYINYDSSIVEEITLADNFFNQEIFKIEHSSLGFIIEPKKEVDNLEDFLNYIFENLKDSLYMSGVKQIRDKSGNIIIRRNKEKIRMEKLGESGYKIIHTGEHK